MTIQKMIAQQKSVELVFVISRNLTELNPVLHDFLRNFCAEFAKQATLELYALDDNHTTGNDLHSFRLIVQLEKGPDNMSGHYAYFVSVCMQIHSNEVLLNVAELTTGSFGLVTSNIKLIDKAKDSIECFWANFMSLRKSANEF